MVVPALGRAMNARADAWEGVVEESRQAIRYQERREASSPTGLIRLEVEKRATRRQTFTVRFDRPGSIRFTLSNDPMVGPRADAEVRDGDGTILGAYDTANADNKDWEK